MYTIAFYISKEDSNEIHKLYPNFEFTEREDGIEIEFSYNENEAKEFKKVVDYYLEVKDIEFESWIYFKEEDGEGDFNWEYEHGKHFY